MATHVAIRGFEAALWGGAGVLLAAKNPLDWFAWLAMAIGVYSAVKFVHELRS